MPSIFLQTVHDANDPMTGSAPLASALAPAPHVVSFESGDVMSGSWFYFSNTWGLSEVTASVDTVTTGSWGYIDYSWGLHALPTESIDRFSLTSTESPSVNQSISAGEWDPFPFPPEPPEEKPAERDITRYRKAYSSQRYQPRRIRYVRRQG